MYRQRAAMLATFHKLSFYGYGAGYVPPVPNIRDGNRQKFADSETRVRAQDQESAVPQVVSALAPGQHHIQFGITERPAA